MTMIKNEILRFLKDIDNDFYPPLSEKVILEEYVDKIYQKSHLISHCLDDGKVVGLVVVYCNDFINYRAYVALVGVLKDYRGKGIAEMMMRECIDYVRNNNFKTIGIHLNNQIAINLYKKLGFNIIEDGNRVYMELDL